MAFSYFEYVLVARRESLKRTDEILRIIAILRVLNPWYSEPSYTCHPNIACHSNIWLKCIQYAKAEMKGSSKIDITTEYRPDDELMAFVLPCIKLNICQYHPRPLCEGYMRSSSYILFYTRDELDCIVSCGRQNMSTEWEIPFCKWQSKYLIF